MGCASCKAADESPRGKRQDHGAVVFEKDNAFSNMHGALGDPSAGGPKRRRREARETKAQRERRERCEQRDGVPLASEPPVAAASSPAAARDVDARQPQELTSTATKRGTAPGDLTAMDMLRGHKARAASEPKPAARVASTQHQRQFFFMDD